MNKLLISMMSIPAIITQSLYATAQHISPRAHKHSANIFDHAAPHNNFRGAAKTTADSLSRVIAFVNLTYNGSGYTVQDSSTIGYSNNRGSTYQQNYFDAHFDTVINMAYTGSAFNNTLKTFQTFDSHNNSLSYTELQWVAGISMWVNSYNEQNTYDAANNQLTSTSQDWNIVTSAWDNYSKQVNTYTATNKQASHLGLDWNMTTSAWDSSYRVTYAHDASDFLVNTISESWNTLTNSWDTSYKLTFVNDASGNVLSETGQMWNGTSGSWENSFKVTRTFDASNRILTALFQIWNDTVATWQNSSMSTFSGHVGNNAGTTIAQSWNNATASFVNTIKNNYVYNADGQPTFFYNERWNTTSGAWERMPGTTYGTRYHYQKYLVVTGTPNITGLNGKASIYPVPAKDAISVNISLDEPQAFELSITDLTGRIITSWSVDECSSYSGNLPVNHLPSGNYLIKMEGPKARLVQRFIVE